jgi:hypothetical protein
MGKKFCLILDIDKVLSADELLAVTESLADEGLSEEGSSEVAVIDAPADVPAEVPAKEAHFETGA